MDTQQGNTWEAVKKTDKHTLRCNRTHRGKRRSQGGGKKMQPYESLVNP